MTTSTPRTRKKKILTSRGFDYSLKRFKNEAYVFVEETPPLSEPVTRVTIKDSEMLGALRSVAGGYNFYGSSATLDSDSLIEYMRVMESIIANPDYEDQKSLFRSLVDALYEVERELVDNIESMIKDGVITYNYLWYLFQYNDEVIRRHGSNSDAGVVRSTSYVLGFTNALEIRVRRIRSNGAKIEEFDDKFLIEKYNGTKKLTELEVGHISQTEKDSLIERAQKYLNMSLNSQYLSYEGPIAVKEGWQTQVYRGDGRCMIDVITDRKFNPSYFDNGLDDDEADDDEVETDGTLNSFNGDLMFATPSKINGFSFSLKKWGQFNVSGLRPIQFSDKAFDLLVLDEELKNQIHALVKSGNNTFSDFIEGKGGGIIFLLHGTPGVGKTATCEAVSEILRRPLYSVSIGELGTKPDEIEKKLREILDLVIRWNAVLLLDEADIFMEARTKHDIIRNSMVGVFLRMLEYHTGVIFLTTNRVENFDSAFLSRISLGIHYKPMDSFTRHRVWMNIAIAAGIYDNLKGHFAALAEFNLNGRQIKNIIRVALALANDAGETLNINHLLGVIAQTIEFQKLVEKPAPKYPWWRRIFM